MGALVAKAEAAAAATAEETEEEGGGGGGGEAAAEAVGETEAVPEAESEGEASAEDAAAAAAAAEAAPGALTPVPPALADALYSQWTTVESAYVEGLRRCFALLREERALGLAHFVDVKSTFLEFLRRPDAKMTTVRDFQSKFNDVDMDHRRDPRTKGELLVRADELRDALWDICDTKLDEAVEERENRRRQLGIRSRRSLRDITRRSCSSSSIVAGTHAVLADVAPGTRPTRTGRRG